MLHKFTLFVKFCKIKLFEWAKNYEKVFLLKYVSKKKIGMLMKLTFTNGSGDEKEIKIKGKCIITDYDTRTKLPNGKDLTINIDGENASIMNGTELQQDSHTVQMNANKYSVFTAIAGMDGDGSNLTEKDIAKAKKNYNSKNAAWKLLENLGVTQIKYDSHAGVATIVIGDKELLRIDFQTTREKIGGLFGKKSDVSAEEVPAEEEVTEPEPTLNPELKFHKNAIASLAKKMDMTEAEINNKISEIAKNVGCTESLVKHLMVTESFIKTAKDIGDGHTTVGFGHTTRAEHNTKFSNGFRISNEQAFSWLEQDIKDKIAVVKKYLPDCDWEDIPQSIRDALVDLAFNAGGSIIKKKDIENTLNQAAETDSYADAAIEASKVYSKKKSLKAGVMKRGCYRFLLSIDTLPPREKIDAMKRFDSGADPYYSTTLKLLRDNNHASTADTLKADWELVYNAAEQALI